MKRFQSTLLLLSLLTAPVWAGGKTEDFKPVDGKENWHYTYDISKLEPGKYNLLIQAVDKAGNTSLAGPFNINVDPLSDIPTVAVNSPFEGMVTNGKLNIVGTAQDDDAIDHVEVRLGDTGDWKRVTGKKFWSYFLDLTALPDGDYAISARSFDVRGKISAETKISFHLDQFLPTVTVDSHKAGSLLAATVSLAGTVTEPNGLRDLAWKLEDEKDYHSLTAKPGTTPGTWTWSFDLDTKTLGQGPQVLGVRARNPFGAQSVQNFFFFVDNAAPVISVLQPAAGTASSGPVWLAGKVVEDVGLDSLTWEIVGEPAGKGTAGSIPLVPGNPYWSLKLDLNPQLAGEKTIRFTAGDRIGNKAVSEFKILLDKEADKPVLSLETPTAGQGQTSTFEVRGWIRDDDKVKSLDWKLGDDAVRTVETTGAFVFEIKAAKFGNQTLTLVPRDSFGTEGNPVKIELSVLPPVPVVKATTLTLGKAAPVPALPGAWLPADKDLQATLDFVVLSPVQPSQINWTLGTLTGSTGSQAAGEGRWSFRFQFEPKNLPEGQANLRVAVKDSFGQMAEWASFLNNHGTESSTALKVADERFVPGQPVLLTADRPLRVVYPLAKAAGKLKADLQPASPDFQAEILPAGNDGDYAVIQLKPVSAGNAQFKGKLLVADLDLKKTEAIDLVLRSNPKDAELVLSPSPQGLWLAKTLSLKGKLVGGAPLEALEASLDQGKNWQPVPVASAPSGLDFDTNLDLSKQPDGNRSLLLRARDKSGAVVQTGLTFFKSTVSPAIRLVTPPAGAVVNGKTLVTAVVESPAPLAMVQASADGKAFTNLGPEPQVAVFNDFGRTGAPLEKVWFKAVDAAGNSQPFTPDLSVDLKVDKPRVLLQVPAEKSVMRSNFTISGLALDDDGISEIWYSLDGTPAQMQAKTDGGAIDIPVLLADITDTVHTLDVYAVDLNGTRSEVLKRSFTVSRSGPVAQVTKPDLSIPQKGRVKLEGTASDPNGVARLEISIDNGSSFTAMDGKDAWSYPIDTKILTDGLYTLIIRAWDTTGAYTDYYNNFSVDNIAPTLSLASPKDGEAVAEILNLEGLASDNMNLKSLRYSLTSLSDKSVPLGGPLPAAGGFTEKAELNKLPPGWYNLALEARDDADNVTLNALNIEIRQKLSNDRLEILFPTRGSAVSGYFKVDGRVATKAKVEQVRLLAAGKPLVSVPVDDNGFFTWQATPAQLSKIYPGADLDTTKDLAISLTADAVTTTGTRVTSVDTTLTYSKMGPWITIDKITTGELVSKRPWVTGRVGYMAPPLPPNSPLPSPNEDGSLPPEYLAQAEPKMEISLDNGVSFEGVSTSPANFSPEEAPQAGVRDWRFRLQTHQIPPGDLPLILRATWPDGSRATERLLLIVDEKKPTVAILKPDEDGRFNESVTVLGTASDENGLSEVLAQVRRGDKAFYAVPSFIQGLYLDGNLWGSTLYSTGLGLTFFGQAVKIQGHFGFVPAASGADRFTGAVAGVKILANVAELPFSSFLGPDWSFFSMTAGVGANFQYFSMTGNKMTFDGKGIILGALLDQVEFAHFSFPELPVMKSVGFYMENSFWFISSDISAGVESRTSIGVRLSLL